MMLLLLRWKTAEFSLVEGCGCSTENWEVLPTMSELGEHTGAQQPIPDCVAVGQLSPTSQDHDKP